MQGSQPDAQNHSFFHAGDDHNDDACTAVPLLMTMVLPLRLNFLGNLTNTFYSSAEIIFSFKVVHM